MQNRRHKNSIVPVSLAVCLTLVLATKAALSQTLMDVLSCGTIVRTVTSHISPLNSIPPRQMRRFAGLLASPLKEGPPTLYITPYLSAHAHKSLIEKTIEDHGLFLSQWIGEIEFGNLSYVPEEPQIVVLRANETSGQWASRLEELAGGKPDERCNLPAGMLHRNSVRRLSSVLETYLPNTLTERSKFIPFSDTNPNAPHFDDELNAMVSYFRQKNTNAGHPPDKRVNINHDIRGPISIVAHGAMAIIKYPDKETRETFLEFMLNAREPVITYLNILQKQYPRDTLLRDARRTLRELGSYPISEFSKPERLERLANLREVIEFIMEIDLSAATEVPLISR